MLLSFVLYCSRPITSNPCSPLPLRSDIGCQIDGYIAQAAHSLVVAADAAAPVTGRAADAIQCAQVRGGRGEGSAAGVA